MDWVIIRSPFGAQEQIGAIAVLDKKISVITTFDDRDMNKDGRVSFGEKIIDAAYTKLHRAPAWAIQVMNAARYNVPLAEHRDEINKLYNDHLVDFMFNALAEAIYTVWFSESLSSICGAIAGKFTKNFVVHYALRKGMEVAIEHEYREVMKKTISDDE